MSILGQTSLIISEAAICQQKSQEYYVEPHKGVVSCGEGPENCCQYFRDIVEVPWDSPPPCKTIRLFKFTVLSEKLQVVYAEEQTGVYDFCSPTIFQNSVMLLWCNLGCLSEFSWTLKMVHTKASGRDPDFCHCDAYVRVLDQYMLGLYALPFVLKGSAINKLWEQYAIPWIAT